MLIKLQTLLMLIFMFELFVKISSAIHEKKISVNEKLDGQTNVCREIV